MNKQRISVGDLSKEITPYSATPIADAKAIVSTLLEIQPNSAEEYELTQPQTVRLHKIIKALRQGEHIAKVLGWTEFNGLKIELPYKVLIPRPETEQLALLSLQAALRINNPHILEIGTGSGCIATYICSQLVNQSAKFKFIGIDVSKRAIANTVVNLEKHLKISTTGDKDHLANFRFLTNSGLISIYLSSLLNFTNTLDSELSLIVANLPYLTQTQMSMLDASVQRHDPKRALAGGEDGLKYFKQLVKLIANHQTMFRTLPEVYLEVDPEIAKDIFAMFTKLYINSDYQVTILDDIFSTQRFLTATKPLNSR
jgi:release factor glutamine methyltransferase